MRQSRFGGRVEGQMDVPDQEPHLAQVALVGALAQSAGRRCRGCQCNRDFRKRSRYSSEVSVNVIAAPVRVAPMPKPAAHVPTKISLRVSGVRL